MTHGLGGDGWPSDETVIKTRDAEIESLKKNITECTAAFLRLKEVVRANHEFRLRSDPSTSGDFSKGFYKGSGAYVMNEAALALNLDDTCLNELIVERTKGLTERLAKALATLGVETQFEAELAMRDYKSAVSELTSQRDELANWKQQAITVLNEIDLQEIGKVLGVGLGESVGPHILPAIKKLTLLTKDTERLDLIDKNYLEISACGGWEEEPTFSVLKVTGNRNDREFKRIGRGDTIREAIDAATANCKERE